MKNTAQAITIGKTLLKNYIEGEMRNQIESGMDIEKVITEAQNYIDAAMNLVDAELNRPETKRYTAITKAPGGTWGTLTSRYESKEAFLRDIEANGYARPAQSEVWEALEQADQETDGKVITR